MSFPYMDRELLQAKTAQDTAVAVSLNGCNRDVTIYIKGNGAVGAGAVQIEEADDENYTGTWSALGSPVTVPNAGVSAVHLTGTHKAVRTRISTAVTGGTVTTRIVAAPGA